LLESAGVRRPFDGKGVALDRGRMAVTFDSEGVDDLAASLLGSNGTNNPAIARVGASGLPEGLPQ
jgi:hypothetical protein